MPYGAGTHLSLAEPHTPEPSQEGRSHPVPVAPESWHSRDSHSSNSRSSTRSSQEREGQGSVPAPPASPGQSPAGSHQGSQPAPPHTARAQVVCQPGLTAATLSPRSLPAFFSLPSAPALTGSSAHLLGHQQECPGWGMGVNAFALLGKDVRHPRPLTICEFISLASVAHFFCCLFHSRPFHGGREKPCTILPAALGFLRGDFQLIDPLPVCFKDLRMSPFLPSGEHLLLPRPLLALPVPKPR